MVFGWQRKKGAADLSKPAQRNAIDLSDLNDIADSATPPPCIENPSTHPPRTVHGLSIPKRRKRGPLRTMESLFSRWDGALILENRSEDSAQSTYSIVVSDEDDPAPEIPRPPQLPLPNPPKPSEDVRRKRLQTLVDEHNDKVQEEIDTQLVVWVRLDRGDRILVAINSRQTGEVLAKAASFIMGVAITSIRALSLDGLEYELDRTMRDLGATLGCEIFLITVDILDEANELAGSSVATKEVEESRVLLKVRYADEGEHGREQIYRIGSQEPMLTLMKAFALYLEVDVDSLDFDFDGDSIQKQDTPESLELEDEYLIYARKKNR